MFRRPRAAFPLTADEALGVVAIIMRIDANTQRILSILEDEDGEEQKED